MAYDRLLDQQETALRQITEYRGKLYADQALQFAQRLGQTLARYYAVSDTVQLSDGEIYTMQRVLYENAAKFFCPKKER